MMCNGHQFIQVFSLKLTEMAMSTFGTSIRTLKVQLLTRRPSSLQEVLELTKTSTIRRPSVALNGPEMVAELLLETQTVL